MLLHQLIANYEKHTHGCFFAPDTLKFYGERLSEMYVLKKTVNVEDYKGNTHTCYVVSSRQHKLPIPVSQSHYPGDSIRLHNYFDTTTFEHIIAKQADSNNKFNAWLSDQDEIMKGKHNGKLCRI